MNKILTGTLLFSANQVEAVKIKNKLSHLQKKDAEAMDQTLLNSFDHLMKYEQV